MGANSVRRFAGLALILMAVAIIAQVVLSTIVGEISGDRSEIGKTLKDIQDNRSAWLASVSVDVVANTLAIIVGAALFVVLNDGTQLRRTIGLVGFAGGSVLFMGEDVLNLVLARLAADAAAGVNADIVAEQARVLVLASTFQFAAGFTLIAAGFAAFNLVILGLPRMPEARLPLPIPRWIGWLGLAVAADMLLIWLSTADMNLFVAALPGLVGSQVWMVALGVVLLRASRTDVPASAPARA